MTESHEIGYLNLLNKIITTGSIRKDRTGVGTIGVFGEKLKFSLENNQLPLLTTKKVFFKGVIEELLFFIKGETNSKKLEEKGVNIWKGNTSREFLDKRNLHHYNEGEMGPMYGNQWRNFSQNPNIKGIDQLANVINLIKTDPYSRRIIVSAYNPLVSDLCVLEPCHLFFQFYVSDDKLSCQFYQRSVDVFLGLPFNIASYSVLTHIIAKACNLQTKEIIFVGGDVHIYSNHIEQAKLQLTRTPYKLPTLSINKNISDIHDMEKLEYKDFILNDYKSYASIKADMAI